MRCPKCGYISFDRVTSCSKCDTDVTELAGSLNGTGFQPMNNFFLGTLLPDYLTGSGNETSSLQDAADDLNISMDDLDTLGDIGDIPGESDGLDLEFASAENDNTISLQGVVVPEVDLSDFDDGDLDNVDTMQISADQLDEIHIQSDDDDQIDLADIPDFDLDGVNLDEDGEGADVSFTDAEVDDVAASVDGMPSLDLDMELAGDDQDDKTAFLNVDDIDAADIDDAMGSMELSLDTEDAEVEGTEQIDLSLDTDDADGDAPDLDLGGIDLSLGDDDSDDGMEVDLADLDLGDLEMESDSKEDELPDLEL